MAISTDKLELLGKDKSAQALKLLLESFSEKYGMSSADVISALSGKSVEDGIPLAVFRTDKISCLEIIVKYLKEETKKTYHQIAIILNRDDRTIWSTYNNSMKKHKTRLSSGDRKVIIPYSIFAGRENSILESLIIHLKDKLNYSFNEIALLLSKDYQTIYTTYKRGRAKK
jgi:hypothetical protein